MSGRPQVAYKVLTSDQLEEFREEGVFAGAPVDLEDGFIHLSTAEQLAVTVAKHFSGQTGLHLAAVDLAALGSIVKWEPSRDGDLFPHIHGTLPMDAVLACSPLSRSADGAIVLPDAEDEPGA